MSQPTDVKPTMVDFACFPRPSSKAQSMEKRAVSGESLATEVNGMPTAFRKVEYEPLSCGPSRN